MLNVTPELSPELVTALKHRRELSLIDWRSAMADLPLYMQAELKRLRRRYRIPYDKLARLEAGNA